MSECDAIVEQLLRARKIVIFTGAGISAESGIATFREKMTGFWEKYDPADFASMSRWNENHKMVWAWYEARRANVMDANPNNAHKAIARLQEAIEARVGYPVAIEVVTQNIDNLHERAGSKRVMHLHGSLFKPRCSYCDAPGYFYHEAPDHDATSVEPPPCLECGGPIRPGVVWFGEKLPSDEFERAKDLARECDVMLVIGTSGFVYPAAMIPFLAVDNKKYVATINPEVTLKKNMIACHWAETAANALPKIIDKIVNE